MSKNNTIRRSDKKFIRLEKARIRRQFLDLVKQEEMINELYKRFVKTEKLKNEKTEKPTTEKVEAKKAPVKKAAKKLVKAK